MKPEKQNLIHDLLDSDSSREATLLAGTRVLRRRRFWRGARRSAAALAVVSVAAVLCVHTFAPRPSPSPISHATPPPQATPQVEALSDDQLLALFPNTP